MSGQRRSREEQVREPERRNLSSFLPLICIILRFHSPRVALRKEGRSLVIYVVACSRRSDRGDNAKRCEPKKTTRGWGRVCFSLFSLAPHSTIRSAKQAFAFFNKLLIRPRKQGARELCLISLSSEFFLFFATGVTFTQDFSVDLLVE